MADIDFDPNKLDELDALGFENENDLDYPGERAEADDRLTPLQKLEKYMESENVYTRQMVARGLLDTMRIACSSETTGILNAMIKLSEDVDPIVRSELMEQVPHVAVFCTEYEHKFESAVQDYILPMVVRYLNDSNNQVRKTSQAALLVLLEQELVSKADIEEQVVGVILELASPDSLDDYRTEAVALMSKMAPLLGREMSERLFLKRYSEMCTDPLMHVRKVCAANFGDICTVVGEESTESQLLEKFYFLCEDGVWGVRKACAECFMAVSCSCSLSVRRNELANLFINLLCDQSRWVRVAAFQQLGPFISTFATDNRTPRHSLDLGDIEVDDIQKAAIEQKVIAELSALDSFTNNNSLSELRLKKTEETCDIKLEEPSEEPMDISEEIDLDDINGAPSDDGNDLSVEEKRASIFSNSKGVENNETVIKNNQCNGSEQTCDKSALNLELTPDENVELSEDIEWNTDEITDADNGDIVGISNRDDSSNTDSSITNIFLNTNTNTNDEHTESLQDQRNSALENEDNSVSDGNDGDHIHSDNLVNNFNSFQFWRTPLPAVNVDLDLVKGSHKNEQFTASGKDKSMIYAIETNVKVFSNELSDSEKSLMKSLTDMQIESNTEESEGQESEVLFHTASVRTVSETHETVDNIGSTHVLGHNLNESSMTMLDGIATQDMSNSSLGYIDNDFSPSHDSLQDNFIDDTQLAQQQDIVPQNLLENYLGMVDPARAQTVDSEITKHCAFNIPAVALTLGRRNWHCIKSLYETLASDMQWKVRKTLAYSIHELAVILGEDITHRDLVPVFDGFLKDLDEVRIGVLRHLADFLRLLHPEIRKLYLPKIQDFMATDNNRNWRFRLELAEQLVLISELYSAYEVSEYLLPIGIALIGDRVSEVRLVSYRLISIILRRFNECGDDKLKSCLVKELTEKFAQSPKSAGRKIFCQLCQVILEENVFPPEQFAQEFLPSLLLLVNDPIPNVRISLARTIAHYSQDEDILPSWIPFRVLNSNCLMTGSQDNFI
ncbi:hypothetical protein ScPMuIL_000480 [Solemya velum]